MDEPAADHSSRIGLRPDEPGRVGLEQTVHDGEALLPRGGSPPCGPAALVTEQLGHAFQVVGVDGGEKLPYRRLGGGGRRGASNPPRAADERGEAGDGEQAVQRGHDVRS